eukprot:TRINITY_DN11067_c0_g5_i2.p1 TRINITY_DN11067_c0_g5~~TRINITY_DN11067_c0_g5_i2.p1  ORF type:complete len:2502 (+),score=564.25 TRINITY_DN11067_c0_g5_i2:638-7507(+)
MEPVPGLPGAGKASEIGGPNHCWACLELLEVLFELAEVEDFGSVWDLFEAPLSSSPEALLIAASQAKDRSRGALKTQLLGRLLPPLLEEEAQHSTLVQVTLAERAPGQLRRYLRSMYEKDPEASFPRLKAILGKEPLQSFFHGLLRETPTELTCILAIDCDTEGTLSLSSWLRDVLAEHKDAAATALVRFLRLRLPSVPPSTERGDNAATPSAAPSGQAPWPRECEPLQLCQAVLWALQECLSKLSPSQSRQVRELTQLAQQVYPSLAPAPPVEAPTRGAPGPPPSMAAPPPPEVPPSSNRTASEADSDELEHSSNDFFRKAYEGNISVPSLVDVMRDYASQPAGSWKHEIFLRMVHILFDECRYFPRYPPHELTITGILFGALIYDDLVSNTNLGLALRCVLEALRRPTHTKMFRFGILALEQFLEKLPTWPQLCHHITLVEHMKDVVPEYVEYAQAILEVLPTEMTHATSLKPEVLARYTMPKAPPRRGLQQCDELPSGPEAAFGTYYSSKTAASPAPAPSPPTPAPPSSPPPAPSAAALAAAAAAASVPAATAAAAAESVMSSAAGTAVFGAGAPTQPPPSAPPPPSPSGAINKLSMPAGMPPAKPPPPPPPPPNVPESAGPPTGPPPPRPGDIGPTHVPAPKAPAPVSTPPPPPAVPKVPTVAVPPAPKAPEPPPVRQKAVTAPIGASSAQQSSGAAAAAGVPSSAGGSLMFGGGGSYTVESLLNDPELQIEKPPVWFVDTVAQIFNSLVKDNVDQKAEDLKEILQPEYHAWLAYYVVKNRAAKEVNFHPIYIEFFEKVRMPKVLEQITNVTYDCLRVLLKSVDQAVVSTSHRTVLKNLGYWLGQITLARNKPLKSKQMDLKSLLLDAFENGWLTAVLPLVCKVLEGVHKSKVYKPPNPWTTAIMSLLSEIHDVPNLRTNLVFEVQVLCKHLDIKIGDLKRSELLINKSPPQGSSDISAPKPQQTPPEAKAPEPSRTHSEGAPGNTAATAATQAAPTAPAASAHSSVVQPPRPVVEAPPKPGPQMRSDAVPWSSATGLQHMDSHIASLDRSARIGEDRVSSRLGEDMRLAGLPSIAGQAAHVAAHHTEASRASVAAAALGLSPGAYGGSYAGGETMLPLLQSVGSGFGGLAGSLSGLGASAVAERAVQQAQAQALQAVQAAQAAVAGQGPAQTAEDFIIPSLPNLVTINPSLPIFQVQPALRSLVPYAVDRAIKEVIPAVVERSVTISCLTTREMVTQDFAVEPDEKVLMKAAQLMVSSVAGSLALVTCREPLRVSLTNHLLQLLFLHNAAKDINENAALEQVLHVVSNDNLDLGCSLIEKAVVDKALKDIEESIAPALQARQEHRLRNPSMMVPYYDTNIINSQAKWPQALPEVLRPKSGPLSAAQLKVYKDFHSLPMSSSKVRLPANLPTLNVTGAIAPSFANSAAAAQAMQAPLPDESTSVLTLVMSTANQVVHNLINNLPLLPPIDSNASLQLYKQDEAMDACAALAMLPLEHELVSLLRQAPRQLMQAPYVEACALELARSIFVRLFEAPASMPQVHPPDTISPLHVLLEVHLSLLDLLRPRDAVVQALTAWVDGMTGTQRYNIDILSGLLRYDLLMTSEFDATLAKWIESRPRDGLMNALAVDFAVMLLQRLCLRQRVLSAVDLAQTVEVLRTESARSRQAPATQVSPQEQTLAEAVGKVVEELYTSEATSQTTGEFPGLEFRTRQKLGHRLFERADEEEQRRCMTSPPNAEQAKAAREATIQIFEEWKVACAVGPDGSTSAQGCGAQLQRITAAGLVSSEEAAERFFSTIVERAVKQTKPEVPSAGSQDDRSDEVLPELDMDQAQAPLNFSSVDAFTRLVVFLMKCADKVQMLTCALSAITKALVKDCERRDAVHNQRPYFRVLLNILTDVSSPDPHFEQNHSQLLGAFANALHCCSPNKVPSFTFAWLELVSSRLFMPKLLKVKNQRGWLMFQRLLVQLLYFLEPYLRRARLDESTRLLYKGTMRVLLVLLHDYPEFLCDYHFSFCDVIPVPCVQIRNLILSAFPRNMKLPDPFMPNLKVDLLPEIKIPPRVLANYTATLLQQKLKADVDTYMRSRDKRLLETIKEKLRLPKGENLNHDTRCNVPLLNALLLYVGVHLPQHGKSLPGQGNNQQNNPSLEIFMYLAHNLDHESRYLFLSAIANHLRYPNTHTHYFSCVLLHIFADTNDEMVREQITRVLLERLIVHRPHPWGLLITFVELIKNRRYGFWSRAFVSCAAEVERLFQSVAITCLGTNSSDRPGEGGNEQAGGGMQATAMT